MVIQQRVNELQSSARNPVLFALLDMMIYLLSPARAGEQWLVDSSSVAYALKSGSPEAIRGAVHLPEVAGSERPVGRSVGALQSLDSFVGAACWNSGASAQGQGCPNIKDHLREGPTRWGGWLVPQPTSHVL